MNVHSSKKIFLLSDDARCFNVVYDPNEDWKIQQVKTLDPTIKPGDFVVVETDTRHKMTVVEVKDEVEPDLESSALVRWVVCKVDVDGFKALKDRETATLAQISQVERRRKRAELREAMLADTDIKSLPIHDASAEAE